MWPVEPTTGLGLFFIGSGCGQIGCVDDGHRLAAAGQETQKSFDQLLIDPPQPGDTRLGAKVAEHAHIRGAMPVIEPGKTSPRRLLRKQACHGIKAVRRTQDDKQMRPPKLSGTEIVASPLTTVARKQTVDELVRNEGRKSFQKSSGASGGKG